MPKEAKNNKEKKHFFKDFKAELKKVIWPTPKQLVNNTVAVITIVLITAVIVFVLDFVFEKINTGVINKIKESVDNKNEISNVVSVNELTTTDTNEVSIDSATNVTDTTEATEVTQSAE